MAMKARSRHRADSTGGVACWLFRAAELRPSQQESIARAPATPGLTAKENDMRALFVGGMVDNSELDMDRAQPPAHYPEDTGGGRSRYRLHHVGRHEQDIAYAVYAAPDLADEEVERIAGERDYARRFDATPVPVPPSA
jgi:hypothetical protein